MRRAWDAFARQRCNGRPQAAAHRFAELEYFRARNVPAVNRYQPYPAAPIGAKDEIAPAVGTGSVSTIPYHGRQSGAEMLGARGPRHMRGEACGSGLRCYGKRYFSTWAYGVGLWPAKLLFPQLLSFTAVGYHAFRTNRLRSGAVRFRRTWTSRIRCRYAATLP